MQFIKKNSYEIVRLFLNQFALAVFGLVLITAARMHAESSFDWLSLVVSICSVLFYLYILYATLLEMGGKHSIKVASGTMAADRHYGLKVMLLAQVPNLVILLLMFLGWLFGFACVHADFFVGLYGVAQILLYFLQSMYDGIIGIILPSAVGALNCFLVWLAYLFSVIPAVLVAWVSYYLGLKNKRLFFGRSPTSDR